MAKAKDTCLGCLVMMGLMIGGGVMFMNWATTPLTPQQQAAKDQARAEADEKRRLEHNAKVAARAITHSPEKQAARDTIIQELMDRGVFQKLQQNEFFTRLYVNPAFYLLPIDDKETFVSVVYMRYCDQDKLGDQVVIVDGLSGKETGEYGPRGLEMY